MTTTPEKSSHNENTSKSILNNSYKHSLKTILKKIYKLFFKKYSKMPFNYNINIIDNIIYNEKSHIVATFKDRLIVDDNGEFLKRYYKKKESDLRLPKFYEYYDLYSKIFPNYTTFYEGKYLYRNIQKKQRMIDLQEKLEMEEKRMKEKNDSSVDNKENEENVFNTEAIDSILNGTNNEGMEIIFNVNKNNIQKDEDIFNKEINDIIDKIGIYENKNKINIDNNKNTTINNINNNINNELNKDSIWNKNISVPININYSKNKRLQNSNSMSTINNTNITYYNNIQSIISKFFNISFHQKNNFLNLYNNKNKNNRIHSKTKNNKKSDKKLVEKMEQNLFKIRKKSIGFQKNLSQNISTSNQTQKDISISKKNSSVYTKKPSSSNSSAQNHKNKIKKNIINSSSYNISHNNIIKTIMKNKNIEIKQQSPLTSRNPNIKKNGLNLYKTKIKNIKNIKGNTYYISDISSRNKYSNNINFNNKSKSTLRGGIYSSSSKILENKYNISKSKNNSKNKCNDFKYRKEMGYKEISFIKKGIKSSKNKNNLKEKLLYNEIIINSSRNRKKNKNISQPKTISNKNNKSIIRNTSSLKLGILDIMNIKKKSIKKINISNFSKVLNASNINMKNTFSKTYRNNYGHFNK